MSKSFDSPPKQDADRTEHRYREIQGELTAAGLRFAVVVSRFNSFITDRLLDGAVDALERAGAAQGAIDVIRVPGAFEVPLAAKHLGQTGQYSAIVCLGAVVRGETPHFEYISAEAAQGISSAALETGVPMSFGILTVENLEQAVERAGLKSGNKGFEAAMTAIEMANLLRNIQAGAAAKRRSRSGRSNNG